MELIKGNRLHLAPKNVELVRSMIDLKLYFYLIVAVGFDNLKLTTIYTGEVDIKLLSEEDCEHFAFDLFHRKGFSTDEVITTYIKRCRNLEHLRDSLFASRYTNYPLYIRR